MLLVIEEAVEHPRRLCRPVGGHHVPCPFDSPKGDLPNALVRVSLHKARHLVPPRRLVKVEPLPVATPAGSSRAEWPPRAASPEGHAAVDVP